MDQKCLKSVSISLFSGQGGLVFISQNANAQSFRGLRPLNPHWALPLDPTKDCNTGSCFEPSSYFVRMLLREANFDVTALFSLRMFRRRLPSSQLFRIVRCKFVTSEFVSLSPSQEVRTGLSGRRGPVRRGLLEFRKPPLGLETHRSSFSLLS